MEEFKRIKRLPPYVFSIVNELKVKARGRGEDIIDFGMGNPDMGTPDHIVDKLVEAARNPRNHRYSASRGITRLRHGICEWYRRRYAVELDPDTEAIATIGAKEGLSHLALAIVDAGDVALVPSPTYPIHPYSVIIAGGDVRHVRLGPGEDFFANLMSAFQECWPQPKLLILSFPHNPTTAVVDLEFFKKIVAFAQDHDLIVVHDFAYADLVFDGYQAPSLLQVPGAKDVGVDFYALEELQHARLAGRVRRREPPDHRGADPDQELSGLRDVPAGPDRLDHRAERTAGMRSGDRGHLSGAARRAL